MKIEVAVPEREVDFVIEGIMKAANTGKIGDGKIFVMDLPDCVRIRTGDRGSKAIG